MSPSSRGHRSRLALLQGEGFVLKIRDFAEADLLVTLFTKQWGKRNAIAKGVKRLNSRLGGVFDLLNDVEIVFYEKPRLDLVSQGALRHGYPKLKRELDGVTVALRVGRLLEQLLSLHQPEARVYSLFAQFLDLLEQGYPEREILHLSVVLKLLALLGHRPQLNACVQCGRLTADLVFVASRGGVFCRHCGDEGGMKIDYGLARGLEALLRLPLEKAVVVRFSANDRVVAQKILDIYSETLVS